MTPDIGGPRSAANIAGQVIQGILSVALVPAALVFLVIDYRFAHSSSFEYTPWASLVYASLPGARCVRCGPERAKAG